MVCTERRESGCGPQWPCRVPQSVQQSYGQEPLPILHGSNFRTTRVKQGLERTCRGVDLKIRYSGEPIQWPVFNFTSALFPLVNRVPMLDVSFV